MIKIIYMIVLMLIVTLAGFLLLNYMYKKTNSYRNSQIMFRDYLCGVPCDLKIVNLGSTYSKYAFENYKNMKLHGFNFALQSQTLEYDRIILENYAGNLSDRCIVVITVAACVMLYRHSDDKSLKYYSILDKCNIPNSSMMNHFKSIFPITCSPKQLFRIIKDVKVQKDIYSMFPENITEHEANVNMNQLVTIWKNLFNLPDLKQTNFSDKNKNDMIYITEELKRIIDFCLAKGFRPIIVVPPFSKNMNQYFSDEFVNSCIVNNIEKANAGRAPFMNYRKNEFFQERQDLFVDGGFRLNKDGSWLFMNMLIRDMKANGITVDIPSAKSNSGR